MISNLKILRMKLFFLNKQTLRSLLKKEARAKHLLNLQILTEHSVHYLVLKLQERILMVLSQIQSQLNVQVQVDRVLEHSFQKDLLLILQVIVMTTLVKVYQVVRLLLNHQQMQNTKQMKTSSSVTLHYMVQHLVNVISQVWQVKDLLLETQV